MVVVAGCTGKGANGADEGSLLLLLLFLQPLQILPFLDGPTLVLSSLLHPERTTRPFTEGPTSLGNAACARMCAKTPQ